jgi:hypothetical protein
MTLLNTIKLPNNLKLLSDRLPKAKYGDDDDTYSMNYSLAEVKSTKSIKTLPALPDE